MREKIGDGLTKTERYRLKDIDAYRKKKKEWAKTPSQKKYRREYMRKWRQKNRERHNALARASHQRNRHKHVHKYHAYHIKRNYGLTIEQYNEMVLLQSGKCAICEKEMPPRDKYTAGTRLHVDHCHVSGNIRMLLCSRCNGALGWYEKYKLSIIEYLTRHETKA